MPDFSKELTIIINEDDPQTTATFTVPEGLLTEHSKFFKAACRDASGEAATVIKLPQVDPDTFRAYLFWIHRRELAFSNISESQGVSASDLYPISLALANLWLLADRLTTTKLRNAVIGELGRILMTLDHTQGSTIEIFPPSMTVLIWPTTTKGRSLRRLVVDYYASKVPIAQVEEHIHEFHPEFVEELTQKIVQMHENTDSNIPTSQTNGYNHEETAPTAQANVDDHEESGPPNTPRPVDTVAQPGNPPATHRPASIILKDKLGEILRASCSLFDTPSHVVGAIFPLLNEGTSDIGQMQAEISLQFPDNTSQTLGGEEWTKTFGEVSTYANYSICSTSLHCDSKQGKPAATLHEEEPSSSNSMVARSPRTWAMRVS